NVDPVNLGGSVKLGGASVTLVPASHSSTYGPEYTYAGPAAGIVLRLADGSCIYYAGDTGVTAEMNIIRDYWQPDLTLLPVGGWLTMDVEQAVYAAGVLLKAKHVIP